MLYWEKISGQSERRHGSGKIMVCGHTQQRSGRPLVLDHAVCIDTWVYGDGWLTCLDVENEAYWQANQRGETRRGRLDFCKR
jgi:serine/threonine protein phosphatase 1